MHVHGQIKQRGDRRKQEYVLPHNNRNELSNVTKIKLGFIIFKTVHIKSDFFLYQSNEKIFIHRRYISGEKRKNFPKVNMI